MNVLIVRKHLWSKILICFTVIALLTWWLNIEGNSMTTASTCKECGSKLQLSIFKMDKERPMPFHYRTCRHDDTDRFFNTHTSRVMYEYYRKVDSKWHASTVTVIHLIKLVCLKTLMVQQFHVNQCVIRCVTIVRRWIRTTIWIGSIIALWIGLLVVITGRLHEVKNKHNDEHEQCPECNIVGMTYSSLRPTSAIIVGGIRSIPRHYHECENCGKEFRTEGERIMNLHVHTIFLKYFQKFEKLWYCQIAHIVEKNSWLRWN